jgi:hypothetical protein
MKRLKKIMIWTGIALGAVIAVLLVVNAILVWTTSSRLEKQIAAIRAAGDPVSLADLAPEPVPAEKNAAVFLRRAEKGAEAIVDELMPVYESGYSEGGPLSESQLKAIQAAFDAHPDVVPLLEQAAACSAYAPEVDCSAGPDQFLSSLMDSLSMMSATRRVLEAQVRLLIAQGKQKEALQTSLTLSRFGRHIQQEPTSYRYLFAAACHSTAVTCANRVLQSGPVSPDERNILEAELARQEEEILKAYQWALKGERAFGLACQQAIPGRNIWFVRAYWNGAASFYLDVLQQQLAFVSRPYAEYCSAQPELSEKGRIFPEGFNVYKALAAIRIAMERHRARTRCLRVLNAVQRKAEEGVADPKLSELGLPAEATTDPFTGEPLHLKKLPDGWLVYSVGRNLKDDGGDLSTSSKDIGVGPLGKPVEESPDTPAR